MDMEDDLEMTVSIWKMTVSICDVLLLCPNVPVTSSSERETESRPRL